MAGSPDHQRGELLAAAEAIVGTWEARFGGSERHPASVPDPERLLAAWEAFAARMGDHYPFFHPRYAGADAQAAPPRGRRGLPGGDAHQPQQPRARRRPGHQRARGGGRRRARRRCSGCPRRTSGTSPPAGRSPTSRRSGWPASCTRTRRIVHSAERALHPRAHVRGPAHGGPSGPGLTRRLHRPRRRGGRVSPRATSARSCSRRARPGSARSTAIDEALALRERYGVRLHVDAAYGGFFTLLAAGGRPARRLPSRSPRSRVRLGRRRPPQARPAALRVRRGALRRSRRSAASIKHDSPYTYFTSGELHLGEISLECSRAGAAAAALWLTLQRVPARPPTTGSARSSRPAAARRWTGPTRLSHSDGAGAARRARARHRDLLPARPTALSSVDARSARC